MPHSQTSRRSFVMGTLSLTTIVMSTGNLPAREPKQLILAFIPQENPEKLIGDIKVITTYLSKEIGVTVRGFVTSDHAAAVEALRNGDADISFMGALPFVIAEKEIGAEVILSEIYRGKATYTSRVYVKRDSGIDSLAELRGKTIAFADPISESGYLYPLELFVKNDLIERGGDPKKFFSDLFFAGGYQQSMQAVASGLVDAAGSSQYAELLLSPEQQSQIKWISESDLIPSHTVIARPKLDNTVKARFVAAMLRLNDPGRNQLLKHVYSPDGYIEANPKHFEGLRRLAAAHGLLG